MHTITAQSRGELFYLDVAVYPRQTMLRLSRTPVTHDGPTTAVIVALAHDDEQLRNVQVADA